MEQAESVVCHQYIKVSGFIDGMFSTDYNQKMEQHLKNCSTCKKLYIENNQKNFKISSLIPVPNISKSTKQTLDYELTELIENCQKQHKQELANLKIQSYKNIYSPLIKDLGETIFSLSMLKYYVGTIILGILLSYYY